MAWIESYKPYSNIRAMKHPNGNWYLKPDGMKQYSTHVKGGKSVIRQYIKDNEIRGELKRSKIYRANATARLHGNYIGMVTAIEHWTNWMVNIREEAKAVVQSNLSNIRLWVSFAGLQNRKLHSITPDDIKPFINDADYKRSTLRKRRHSINSFFKYHVGKGNTYENPAADSLIFTDRMTIDQLEIEKKIPFNASEIRTIFNYLLRQIDQLSSKPRLSRYKQKQLEWYKFWYSASVISYQTGLRLRDLAQLEFKAFREDGFLIFPKKTRDVEAELPFSEIEDVDLLNQALNIIPQSKSQFCFPFHNELYLQQGNNPFSDKHRKLLDAMGITERGKSIHSWRHMRIQYWKDQGKTEEQISRYTGISSQKTIEHYGVKGV